MGTDVAQAQNAIATTRALHIDFVRKELETAATLLGCARGASLSNKVYPVR